jgi:hypothetical protein
MLNPEDVARELGKAKSIDDFYGKEGILNRSEWHWWTLRAFHAFGIRSL